MLLNDESSDVTCKITAKGACGSLGQVVFLKHGLMTFEPVPNQFSQIHPTGTAISPAVKYQKSRPIFPGFCGGVSCISTAAQAVLSLSTDLSSSRTRRCSRAGWEMSSLQQVLALSRQLHTNGTPPHVATDMLIRSPKLLRRLPFDVEEQRFCSEPLRCVNCLHGWAQTASAGASRHLFLYWSSKSVSPELRLEQN